MLYTFTLTESQLEKVSRYLDQLYTGPNHQYILGLQTRLTDDLVVVIIDCSEESALWISLIS